MDTPWEPSTVNSISTHILQAFLKDANHNSLIFCKPSWAGRLICAVMALVLQSVSWPINEKVNQSINQSIKLVINRSITKKISESQGISACSGCWFFYGCSDANPPWSPNFSGQKKATRLCFWPSVDVETGHPLRGMGHESPGCIQIDLQVPNIGLKTMRTQIRSWYHSGLPNTRVYAEREINTKSQWFAYELLKLQSDLAWYITNCNMWYGGFLKWVVPPKWEKCSTINHHLWKPPCRVQHSPNNSKASHGPNFLAALHE